MIRWFYFYFLLLSVPCSAAHPESLFQEGNRLYRERKYEEAIRSWDSVRSLGYESAVLYFNMGNAFYKLRRTAPSILNYERALRLDPSDEDIELNLRLVRLRTVDVIEPLPVPVFLRWYHAMTAMFAPDEWSVAALLLLWLALAGFGAYMFSGSLSLQKIAFSAGMIFLFSSAACFTFAWQQHRDLYGTVTAVLFTDNAPVKSEPSEDSTDLFIIHEGAKMDVLQTLGEWTKIRLADGKTGWVRKNDVVII